MRPSGITDGILAGDVRGWRPSADRGVASMRPSGITDGINRRRSQASPYRSRTQQRFNEAVGYYRRNHGDRSSASEIPVLANEVLQ